MGGIQQASSRLARFLELKTGKPAVWFSELDTRILRWSATGLVTGTSVEEIIRILTEYKTASRRTNRLINNNEILEMLRETKKMETTVDEVVTYNHRQKQDDGWQEDEREVRDLMADMVFSLDTWEADETQTEPGERMRRMLLNHVDIMAQIMAEKFNRNLDQAPVIERMLDKLPLYLMGKDPAKFKKTFRKWMTDIDLAITEHLGEYTERVENEMANKEKVKKAITFVLQSKAGTLQSRLAVVDADVSTFIGVQSEEIQNEITVSLEEQCTQNDNNNRDWNPAATIGDPEQKMIPPEERKRRIAAGEEALNDKLKDALSGESGQALFIKTVFSRYFSSVERIDQRSMFASAIRSSVPSQELPKIPSGADEEQIVAIKKEQEKIKDSEKGRYLAGILKGAGPLFQKLLQGVPSNGLRPELQMALEDMKSKLAPIPDAIVKAQLFAMVERSKGKITKIEVEKALGAASVGQTFMCKMYGPEYPEEGKSVVIKLLKPDVRNRMMREKDVMLLCARQADPDHTGGMEATYRGQLSRIEEELDLTIEARNVVTGAIYDKSTIEGVENDGVQSMKLDSAINPTINAMGFEKAKGETVDRYLKEIGEKLETWEEQLQKQEDEIVKSLPPLQIDNTLPEEEQKKLKAEYNEKVNQNNEAKEAALRKYLNRKIKLRMTVTHELSTLIKWQMFMARLAEKWVTEGIFGEGFYHGDLHADNIMNDDDGVTVIDFGNATKLSDDQQVQVTRMVGASAVGDVDGFQDGLHALLKPEFEPIYKQKKSALKRELKKIFALGDKNSVGQRVAVALLKAQELGLEVPSAIFNFSQCQLRLQNAIEDMNAKIESMKLLCGKMDEYVVGDYADPFQNVINTLSAGKVDDETGEQVIKREYIDNLTNSYLNYNPENMDVYRTGVLDGSFYAARLSAFEGDTVTQISNKVYGQLMMCSLILKKGVSANGQNWTADIAELLAPMRSMVGVSRMTKTIEDYFKVYEKKIGDIQKETQARIDEVNKREDETGKEEEIEQIEAERDQKLELLQKDFLVFATGSSDQLTAVENEMKPIVAKYHATKLVLDDKTKTNEEKDVAMNEFLEAYKPINIKRANTTDTFMEKFIDLVENPYIVKDVDQAIDEMAAADETLGAELKTAYRAYREFTKTHGKEDPEYAPHEQALRTAAGNLTQKRLAPYFEDMKTVYETKTLSFVEVMGDTICKNLMQSLKRLGMFTAMSYQKKLQ